MVLLFKMHTAVVVALLCALLASPSLATGGCYTDEICGLTDFPVTINSFSAAMWVVTELNTVNFQATNPTGFGLNTVGGIQISASSDMTINTDADINLSAPISGEFEVNGDDVDFQSWDFTAMANDFALMEANFISFQTGTNTTGDVIFDSNLETTVEGVYGIELGSMFRDTNFNAPSGQVSFSSDVITIISGDTIDDQVLTITAGSNIEFKGDGVFDVNSGASLSITGTDDVSFKTKSKDIVLEAWQRMDLSGFNVNLDSTSYTILQTLIGDLVIQAADTADFFGFTTLAYADFDNNLSADTFQLYTTGDFSVGERAATTINVNAGTANYVASDTITLRAIFDGSDGSGSVEITTANMDVSTENLYFQTRLGLADHIGVAAENNVNFVGANQGFTVQTHILDVFVFDSITLHAADDLSIVSPSHNEFADYTARDGFIFLLAPDEITIDANLVFMFNDNAIITESVTDDVTYNASADGALLYMQSTQDEVLLGDDIDSYSEFSASVSADYDINLSALSDVDFTVPLGAATLFSVYDTTLQAVDDINISQSTTLVSTLAGNIYTDSHNVNFNAASVLFLAAAEDDQEMFIDAGSELNFDGSSGFFSAGSTFELGLPSAGLDVTTSHLGFNGNEQYFISTAGSIVFDIPAETSINADDGVFFVASDQIAIYSLYDAYFTASNVNIDSATSINFDASVFDLISDGTSSYKADESVTVTSSDILPINAEGSNGVVDVIGGEISITSVTDDVNIWGDMVSVWAKGELQMRSFGAGADFEFLADGDVTTTVGNQADASGRIHGKIGNDYMIFNTQDIVYNSAWGQSISFLIGDSFLYQFGPAGLNTWGNNIVLYAAEDANFQATNGGLTHTTTTSTQIYSNGDISLSSSGDFSVNAGTFSIYLDELTFDISEWTGGDLSMDTCDSGNVDIYGYQIAIDSVMDVPFQQILDPCGTCTDNCTTWGNFQIVSHADATQSIYTNNFWAYGNNSITLQTAGNGMGALSFSNYPADITQGMMTLNSSRWIHINSENNDYELHNERDDGVWANNGNVTIDADTWISFTANGAQENFNMPNYGMLLQTLESCFRDSNLFNDATCTEVPADMMFRAPQGSLKVTAEEVLHIGTSQPLFTPTDQRGQDLNVDATRDILFNGNWGPIMITSQGPTNRTEEDVVDVNGSLSLIAEEHDMVTYVPNADLLQSGMTGISLESFTQGINFTAAGGIWQRTTSIDGNMLYQTNFGQMPITAMSDDITLHAGDELMDSDFTGAAFDQLYVTSGQEQHWASYGALSTQEQVGINLTGEDGPITVTSADDVEFFAAGDAIFDAATGMVNVSMMNDVKLISDARAEFISQFTSSTTVTAGDMIIDSNGGGGSVDIKSDSNQDIIGTAGSDISVTAHNNVVYEAKTGITATTATGDISIANEGDNQDMLAHSEGTVVLRALGQQGIDVRGRSIYVNAFNDILTDSNFFNVGSTGNTDTATEPMMVFNAGGDDNTDGLDINSIGDIDWTTEAVSKVHFEGNTLNVNAGNDFTINANGPMMFSNTGEFDDGVFTITANAGPITMDGEQAVRIHGMSSNTISTPAVMSLQAIGGDSSDAMVMHSDQSFFINTVTTGGSLSLNTGILSGEFRDYDVAANNIWFNNTVGDLGSLSFDSDTTVDTTSAGRIAATANGEINFSTLGEHANVVFDATGNGSVTAGEDFDVSGTDIDVDSPNGLSFISNGDDLYFESTDDLMLIANGTLTATSYEQISITAGFLTGDSDKISYMNISSRGTADFVSTQDFAITSDSGEVSITSDRNLSLGNRDPSRSRDQGDVNFDANGELIFESGNDMVFNAVARDMQFSAGGDSSFNGWGDLDFTATATGASLLVEADQDAMNFFAAYQASWSAGNSGTVASLGISATSDIEFTQRYEDNPYSGIQIYSNGDTSSTLTVTASDDVSIGGEAGVSMMSTNGYVSLATTTTSGGRGDFDIESLRDGADVMFHSTSANIILTVVQDATFESFDDDGMVRIESLSTGGSSAQPNIHFTSTDGDVDILTTTAQQAYDIRLRSDLIVFDQALEGNNRMTIDADETVSFISNGISTRQTNYGGVDFGIWIESDSETEIDANDIRMEALDGVVNLLCSENYAIDFTSEIEANAGDILNIYTSFTPPFGASISQREAIYFEADRLTFRSNHKDIRVDVEDVSWSIDGQLYMRQTAPGGAITFHTSDNQLDVDVNTFSGQSNRVVLQSGSTLNMDMSSTMQFNAYGSITANAISTVNIDASNTLTLNAVSDSQEGSYITLDTDFGVVDFQPFDNNDNGNPNYNTPFLLIPPLRQQAGVTDVLFGRSVGSNYYYTGAGRNGYIVYFNNVISGHANSRSFADMYRWVEENNQPECENREFGFDEFTYDLCWCDWGKWRCNRDSYNDMIGFNNWYRGFLPPP